MADGEALAQIQAPHFTAGIVVRNGLVIDAAPIVRYLMGWEYREVDRYCILKRWRLQRVP